MPVDKSLFFYGRIYHKLLDPHQAEAREVIGGFIPEGASVLDIACGTGQLSFVLRVQKQCRVVDIDLSLRMLQFAEKSNCHDNVKFVHQDATDLAGFGDHSFDYAIVLLLMHELPREKQLCVLSEALRVVDKTIIVDASVPLPKNLRGFGVQLVEATFGRDHHGYFRDFLASGGIMGLLENSGLPITIAHRSVFWHSCHEIVMVSRRQQVRLSK